MGAAFKQEAHRLIDQLPESASWDDLAEKVRFLAGVERGVAAADRGSLASPERVRAMFARWGVDVEG
jgi:predicted transcriptional regulator